jgi:hypothetical protein
MNSFLSQSGALPRHYSDVDNFIKSVWMGNVPVPLFYVFPIATSTNCFLRGSFRRRVGLASTNCWYDSRNNNHCLVGFKVLTAVVMKSTISWDITSCSPSKFKRCFGGAYRLHLQGRKISRARNQLSFHLLSRWFLTLLIFQP